MSTCHVLMAIDASGSMYDLAEDVRGGFNQYLDTLTADTDTTYYVTVALFNTRVEFLAAAVPLAEVPRLTRDNYEPGGGTALLDAIGKLVTGTHPVGDGDKVLVVVNTDGCENSSKEWTHNGITALIDTKKDSEQWAFVFLGAGVAAWAQGPRLGFASGQTLNTSGGTRSSYAKFSNRTVDYAHGKGTAQDIADDVSAASQAEEGGNGGS